MATSFMAGSVPSPLVVGSPALRQGPLPSQPSHTPSPVFPYPTPLSSVSVDGPNVIANKSGSLRPVLHRYSGVALRTLALFLSFSSSLAIAVPPPKRRREEESFSLNDHREFIYCLIVVILSSLYSAVQLLKGTWDELAYKGFIVSTKTSDYLTFFLDQVMAYLLFSSSSVAVTGTVRITGTAFHSAAVVSLVFSFAASVAMAASAVRSGHQLSKRMSW